MGPNLHDYWSFLPEWLPIKTYGLFIAFGFLFSAFFAYRRAKRVGLDGDRIIDLALWTIVAGIAGSRLFYIVQFYEQQFAGRPLWAFFALHHGGLVFYGGILGALPACVWYIYKKKLPVWRTLDLLASAAMLGLAFGRLGCFSYGCCWGVPTHSACGVVFPPDAPAYARPDLNYGTALFPTQLLSALTAFLLFLVLSAHFRWFRKRDGETVALLFILYPINRFILEFWRHDTRQPGELSVSQWVSILMLGVGLVFYALALRRPPAPTGAQQAEPEETPPLHPRHTSKSKKRRMRE